EGGAWAEKVGRRYEFLRLAKESATPSTFEGHANDSAEISGRFGLERLGDHVRAIVAYSFTRAIAPIRISLSMYLSPAFS
ncbi:hypothetical protein OE88DRAFT_1631780, partial [Heliocybe sulcata]